MLDKKTYKVLNTAMVWSIMAFSGFVIGWYYL